MSSILSVQNLITKIGGKIILKDINFEAYPGEFIGIIGPNGAGKSTLLKSIRGLVKPNHGTIKIHEHNIAKMRDKSIAKWIAYMQQEVNVEFGITALDVVLAARYPYISWWQNENKKDIAIAKKYMSFTGVEKFAERSVRDVSGGERQRILLAKVLAQETPLIFLDEPTASLDLMYQEEIFRYCNSVCRQNQEEKAILMVVHDIRMAAKFCSRLILIANGEIVADGLPENVITEQNLQRAYGMQAVVFQNVISGGLDFHTYKKNKTISEAVFILGSGDHATKWIRKMFEDGYKLHGGIFCEGELDAYVAKSYNIQANFLVNWTSITEEVIDIAKNNQALTAWTFLPNMFYTEKNLYNLKLAMTANHLIIIEDEAIEQRDFTGGIATNLYKKILQNKNCKVFSSAQFLQYLQEKIK